MKTKAQTNTKAVAATEAVAYKPSNERTQLETLLAELVTIRGGAEYKDEYVDILTWGRDVAKSANQIYVTKQGNAGFTWGTKEGRYTVTKNKETGNLYVTFTTYTQLKAQAAARKAHTEQF